MNKDIKIISSAINVNGVIYTSKSHSEIIPKAHEETGKYISQDMQGFIASDGKFYNREQSGIIAYNSGQTEELCNPLLSEYLLVTYDSY